MVVLWIVENEGWRGRGVTLTWVFMHCEYMGPNLVMEPKLLVFIGQNFMSKSDPT